jgi:hypothetical protein
MEVHKLDIVKISKTWSKLYTLAMVTMVWLMLEALFPETRNMIRSKLGGWQFISKSLGLQNQFIPPRPHAIPDHMMNTFVFYERDLLSEDVAAELRNLTKTMKTFPTNLSDLKFYKTTHEHIGEATPLEADGSCANPFLMASIEKTKCVLPGRIDVGRHWVMTGGPNALRES